MSLASRIVRSKITSLRSNIIASMARMGVGYATKQFFQTTTLHGFKYLASGFHADRICWVSWCAASACCAGALCAVLWARFLQVPALLVVRAAGGPPPLPTVGVCLPPISAASLLVNHLSTEKEVMRRLVYTFSRILEGREAPKDHLVLLEQLLVANNLTVPGALYDNMPACHEFTKRCRWQGDVVPCRLLFHRELTQFGVCCTMQPNKMKKILPVNSHVSINRGLSLLLQCARESLFKSCQFFTKYQGEESIDPVQLRPGLEYQARVTFNSVQDSDSEKLVAGSCVSTDDYSRANCLDKCMERLCGCSNPFRRISEGEGKVLPPCPVSQINCLRDTDNSSCNCLPSCETLSTNLELENSPMKSVEYTIDPLYSGINVSASTVLKLRVSMGGSRIFIRQPTETWFTLLSSLGGVFNMFLGVGLFSALELIFFLLVRIPKAIKHGSEMSVVHLPIHARGI